MDYTGTGGFRLRGCAVVTKTDTIITKFEVRDSAYVCEDSLNGISTKIWIKKILINSNVIVYKDTYNELWLEDELCTAEEASDNITAYEDYLARKLEDLAGICRKEI